MAVPALSPAPRFSVSPAIRVGTQPELPGVSAPGSEGGLDRDGLRRAAEGFEAMFLRQILSAARAADFGGNDLFGGEGAAGGGMETFTEMRDAEFAGIAARRGTLGIAQMLEAHFARQFGSLPAAPTGKEG